MFSINIFHFTQKCFDYMQISKTAFTIKSEKINFILEQNVFYKSCSKWSMLLFQIFFILPKS